MKIAIVLMFSYSLLHAGAVVAQKCDSIKVGIDIKHTSGFKSGELTFKPALEGSWQTHLIGPTPQESISNDKLSFKNLPVGYYDFYLIDKNKRFCVKHIKVKID